MPWQITSQVSLPAAPSDAWTVIALPIRSGAINYAFRVVLPFSLPENWQVQGYWCFVQIVEGIPVLSASHELLTIKRNGEQPLVLVGVDTTDAVADSVASYHIAISVNRWIPRSVAETWARL